MKKMIACAFIIAALTAACGSTPTVVESVNDRVNGGYVIYLMEDGTHDVVASRSIRSGNPIEASAKRLATIAEARAFALRILKCGAQCLPQSSAAPPKARQQKEASKTQCPARLPSRRFKAA